MAPYAMGWPYGVPGSAYPSPMNALPASPLPSPLPWNSPAPMAVSPAALPFSVRELRPALSRAASVLANNADDTLKLRAKQALSLAEVAHEVSPRHKTPPGIAPRNWNLSLLIPPLGIASALVWGVSNIYEHSLQAGHALKLPFVKTTPAMARVLTRLAVAAPVINVAYGALNAVGALAQGYSMRTVAFGAFTLFSAALALPMLHNNRLAVTMAKKLAELPKNPALKAEIEALAKDGLKWHGLSSLYNAVAPVGLLTGLFSITKVAQSTPGMLVEHPVGDTWRQMTDEAPHRRSLFEVLGRNARLEWNSFLETAARSAHHARQALGDFAQAFRNLWDPPPHLQDQPAFARFMDPITSGMAVPLFYSHATLGRVLYSTLAAGMFLGLGGAAIRSKSVYDAALKAVGKAAEAAPAQAKGLNKVLSSLLVWGNFSGTPAGLFTRFNDWPLVLSSVYRTSGFAYGASALSSALKLAGVQKWGKFYHDGHILGFDERALTKIGAFIQGTSYFVNLLLKNLSGTGASAASHGLEAEPGGLRLVAQ